jgi:hypothetical protein
MRHRVLFVTLALSVAGVTLGAQSPSTAGKQTPHPSHGVPAKTMSTEEKIKLALSAAPADLARGATVVEPAENGQMKTLRPGTNGWVCMAMPEVMCLDKQWQAWADAWINKKGVTIEGVGVAYMLRGDQGASNTDPYATGPAANNQWVETGPHIMILTPDTAHLNSLPTDPLAGGPFVMWKGTPYAHIMIPVEPMPKQKAPTPAAK